MEENSKRWHQITPSAFPHERSAIAHVRTLLPDRHPYGAWSNFEFISSQGHIREVDLLLATPGGLVLLEVKNLHGTLRNRNGIWVQERPNGRSKRTFDNPLLLANQKAKELRSLLANAASRERDRRIQVPYVQAAVLLAEPGMRCELDEQQRHHIYGPQRDGAAKRSGALPAIGSELILAPPKHTPPSPDFWRVLDRLLDRVGVHRTRRSVTVNGWQINPTPYESGPTWQDHSATREDLPKEHRRVRIYLYERESDADKRRSIEAAAKREFRACQGLRHEGLLVPADLAEHEAGPALLIPQPAHAMRLDHYIAEHNDSLELPVRLDMVRQLAETVRYAHGRRLVHRALSPRAVIVEPTARDWLRPQLRIGEWQAATRGIAPLPGQPLLASNADEGGEAVATSTGHQVAPSTDASQHIEASAAPYLAPEFTEGADGSVAIDIFGLGTTSYLVLTGRPPASSRAELLRRLADQGGLSPAAVVDDLPDVVDAVISLATAPVVKDRFADVDELLHELDPLINPKNPEPPVKPLLDPWDARKGDLLGDTGFMVERVLGTGSTSRALLVQRDNERSVLKVARSEPAAARLHEEQEALRDVRHDHIVVLRRGVYPVGNQQVIETDFAGEQTLGQMLRSEGALLTDQLQSFGNQLLAAMSYLERQGLFHRDIKPDNLGVLQRDKQAPKLMLFDFSLSQAAVSDIRAGTRGYVDPFLGSDRRPEFDAHAERYSAAVTLHEMASLELPAWGDDGTAARFVTEDVTLSEELFGPTLRDPLTTFFRRALHRDAEQRFADMAEMRQAWQQVFASVDEALPATTSASETDEPEEQRNKAAKRAQLDTALDAAGLSPRAVAVAQRMKATTVRDLLGIAHRDLWRARGLSKRTRTELTDRSTQWRSRLLTDEDPDLAPMGSAELDGPRMPVDRITARLLPQARRGTTGKLAITRLLLGLPEIGSMSAPEQPWPTNAQVAKGSGLTAGRVSQVLPTLRREWRKSEILASVHEEVVEALESLHRVASSEELAEHLLMLHGCATEMSEDSRRRFAHAVLRAVVEADSLGDVDGRPPRFATRRHHGRMLIALQVADEESLDTPSDVELLDLAVALGAAADQLAMVDPLPTPTAVVRALTACTEKSGRVIEERRLVRLAAAASKTALANARMELYRRDLSPERALRLTQAGAAVPEKDGLTAAQLHKRVESRFPGLAPLPEKQELADLLNQAGFRLNWTGKEFLPPSSSLRSRTSLAATSMTVHPTPALATAGGEPDARLRMAVRRGGVRMVTMRPKYWLRVRDAVQDALGVVPIDVTGAFARSLRETAESYRIPDFTLVLRADNEETGSVGHRNLHQVISEAMDRLEREWSTQRVLVLDGLTPLGRYPQGRQLVERLCNRARQGGSGPDTLVLLCPMGDERQHPRIDAHVLTVLTPDEWIVPDRDWGRDRTTVA